MPPPRGGLPEGRALAPTALLVASALAVGSIVPIVRDALIWAGAADPVEVLRGCERLRALDVLRIEM